jgi:hypothetical protein
MLIIIIIIIIIIIVIINIIIIRFVSLRGVVASESIQTLCILLRKQNLSFLEARQSRPWSYTPGDIKSDQEVIDYSPSSIHDQVMAALLPGREGAALGLQGLAITHNQITPTDVKYLCDLLEPILTEKKDNTEKNRDRVNSDREGLDTPRSKGSGGSSRMSSVARPGGLKYLDLGFNKMVSVYMFVCMYIDMIVCVYK